ncbi:MAG: hypothetical protein Q8N88_01770 [Nanoarchaeota archaeon]|nr:hypothetical protein [Nanoarchaeota archaeon]
MVSAVIDFLNWFRLYGGFSYVSSFLFMFFIFYLILFYIVNRINFLQENKAIKFLVCVLISGFIANILSLLFLQFDLISGLFALFEFLFLVLVGIIMIASIILWIWALTAIIRFSESKAIMIISLILGGIFSGWAYLIFNNRTA